jgi:hypothetical protein
LGPLGKAVARTGGESHDWSGHFETGMVATDNTFRAMTGDDLAARAKGGKS